MAFVCEEIKGLLTYLLIPVLQVYCRMCSTGDSILKCSTPFKYNNVCYIPLSDSFQIPGDLANFQDFQKDKNFQ